MLSANEISGFVNQLIPEKISVVNLTNVLEVDRDLRKANGDLKIFVKVWS